MNKTWPPYLSLAEDADKSVMVGDYSQWRVAGNLLEISNTSDPRMKDLPGISSGDLLCEALDDLSCDICKHQHTSSNMI
jgi:hypothetical protein